MAPAKGKQAQKSIKSLNVVRKSEKYSHFYQFVMGGFGFD